MTRRGHILRWCLLVLLVSLARPGRAQSRVLWNSPKGVNLRITDVYLQTDARLEHEIQEAGAPGLSVTRDRFILEPQLGLGLGGWAYHPNLLEYHCQLELGLDYQDASVSPGDSATDTSFLQRYHATLDFLRQKPYATSFFADQDLTYRDYDFFSRVRVDSERFGFRSGYSAGPVPFAVSFQHYDEAVADLSRPTHFTEDLLSFTANSLRRAGKASTQLTYNFNSYQRDDDGFSHQSGLNQNLSVFDSENFGAGDWIYLSSLLNYNSVTETAQPSDKLLFQEQLQLRHTPSLRSFYSYEFDYATAGDSTANTHQGRAGLTHQLYENLTSSLDVHGNLTHADAPGSVLDTDRYGAGLSEQYTRSLGNWGNLQLGYAGGLDREERSATGSVLDVLDEAHTLTDGSLVFLTQPFVVDASIRVTDQTGTILYLRDLDYVVISQGALTEIRRVPGGTIPNGATVLVDYSAVLDPSASYTSYANSGQFRLDLWKGLLGLYGHWTTLDFSGGEQLNLRWMDDRTVGLDSTWRWLRVGAEYQIVDSNLSPYTRQRCFQSAQFRPAEFTLLGLDLDQSWTDFRDSGRKQTSYGATARLQQRLTPTLAWSAEGGIRMERGETFDADHASARTELNWAVGKLTLKFGYEYGSESHPTDLRERHFVYLRARRTF